MCYFVTWREGLYLGMTRVVLIKLEEHMLKSTFKTLELSIELGMILPDIPGFINCFKLDHVLLIRTMRQMVRCTGTSVFTVWKSGNS